MNIYPPKFNTLGIRYFNQLKNRITYLKDFYIKINRRNKVYAGTFYVDPNGNVWLADFSTKLQEEQLIIEFAKKLYSTETNAERIAIYTVYGFDGLVNHILPDGLEELILYFLI